MRVCAEEASPEGKLAPQATEGELRAKRYDYPFGYNNSSLSFRIPLQSLRDSFPSGDAFITRIRRGAFHMLPRKSTGGYGIRPYQKPMRSRFGEVFHSQNKNTGSSIRD